MYDVTNYVMPWEFLKLFLERSLKDNLLTFVEFDFCLFVFYRLGRPRHFWLPPDRNYKKKKQKNIIWIEDRRLSEEDWSRTEEKIPGLSRKMASEKYHENDSMLQKEELKPKPWAKCKLISSYNTKYMRLFGWEIGTDKNTAFDWVVELLRLDDLLILVLSPCGSLPRIGLFLSRRFSKVSVMLIT